MSWSIIATWDFSLDGVKNAAKTLEMKGSALDAVEEVGRIVEADPKVDSVGFGGLPNRYGEVELDAAVMDGKTLSIGAVAGLKGFIHPISIARKVMTHTPHTILVGEGAEDFALQQGFERTILINDKSRMKWEDLREKMRKGEETPPGHDTVGIVALDKEGNMACGTSTSGLFMKHKGRVGDSPIVGSGFYVDNELGGAAATGVGEDIMRTCLCFQVVQLMGQGYSPEQAAQQAVYHTHNRLSSVREKVGDISVVCMNNKGEWGAATNRNQFQHVVASAIQNPILRTVSLAPGISAGVEIGEGLHANPAQA